MASPTNGTGLMRPIEGWEDGAAFANHLVAYETDSPYFGSENEYILPGGAVRFGFIERTPSIFSTHGRGYELIKLIQNQARSRITGLIDFRLNLGHISMRMATQLEAKEIHNAIQVGRARFEYTPEKEEAFSLLGNHVQWLNSQK